MSPLEGCYRETRGGGISGTAMMPEGLSYAYTLLESLGSSQYATRVRPKYLHPPRLIYQSWHTRISRAMVEVEEIVLLTQAAVPSLPK